MPKILTLKNYYLMSDIDPETGNVRRISLQGFLDKLNAIGQKQSRRRNRFVKVCNERAAEIEQERLRMAGEHAEKDEEGNAILYYQEIVKDADGKPVLDQRGRPVTEQKETTDKGLGKSFKIADPEAFGKDYFELLQEEFLIEVTETNKENIDTAKELLLNAPTPLSAETVPNAATYDEWCEAFENIREPKKEKEGERKEPGEGGDAAADTNKEGEDGKPVPLETTPQD